MTDKTVAPEISPQQQIIPEIKQKRKRGPYVYTKKTGRPSSIDKISLKKCEILYKQGWTDEQVANFFDLTVTAIAIYKTKHPKFFNTIKDWKLEADHKVEKSLYQRALGYQYDEVTYEQSKTGGLGIKLDDGDISEIKHTPTCKVRIITKQVIPDVLAQMFWLKNRKPAEWREKHEVEHSGSINLHAMITEGNELRDRMPSAN